MLSLYHKLCKTEVFRKVLYNDQNSSINATGLWFIYIQYINIYIQYVLFVYNLAILALFSICVTPFFALFNIQCLILMIYFRFYSQFCITQKYQFNPSHDFFFAFIDPNNSRLHLLPSAHKTIDTLLRICRTEVPQNHFQASPHAEVAKG